MEKSIQFGSLPPIWYSDDLLLLTPFAWRPVEFGYATEDLSVKGLGDTAPPLSPSVETCPTDGEGESVDLDYGVLVTGEAVAHTADEKLVELPISDWLTVPITTNVLHNDKFAKKLDEVVADFARMQVLKKQYDAIALFVKPVSHHLFMGGVSIANFVADMKEHACRQYRLQQMEEARVKFEKRVVDAEASNRIKKLEVIRSYELPLADRAIDMPVEAWSTRVWRNVKVATLMCVGYATFESCGHGEAVRNWQRERKFTAAVSSAMCEPVIPRANATVEETVVQELHEINVDRLHHVPRIVAQATVALRMKLGMGAMNRKVAGNEAVVRAEAARLLRDWNVRSADAAVHLLAIERCFFEDDTHYQLQSWRAKACNDSRLIRWLIGRSDTLVYDF